MAAIVWWSSMLVAATLGSGGPPPNLRAGAFQSLVNSMWRGSPTFRQQCSRLAAIPPLRVTIVGDVRARPTYANATTTIVRQRGTVVAADIVIKDSTDMVELIAHEIEHVIEQIDNVDLRADPCNGGRSPHGSYESCRALEAGRRVAKQMQQAARGGLIRGFERRRRESLVANIDATCSDGPQTATELTCPTNGIVSSVGRGRGAASQPNPGIDATLHPGGLDATRDVAQNAHRIGGTLDQQELERIARKALKELGVSASTPTVVQAGPQPGVWRIDVGDRSLNIRCGQGSTAQWVRTQIFDQFLGR